MSPRFVLGRKNVPCVAEVINRLLKADCTDFTNVGLAITVCLRAKQIIYFKNDTEKNV